MMKLKETRCGSTNEEIKDVGMLTCDSKASIHLFIFIHWFYFTLSCGVSWLLKGDREEADIHAHFLTIGRHYFPCHVSGHNPVFIVEENYWGASTTIPPNPMWGGVLVSGGCHFSGGPQTCRVKEFLYSSTLAWLMPR